MSGKIHTFVIEIPGDLELTPEEIANLEGRFQEDAGIIINMKEGLAEDHPFVNIGAVRVVTRLQPEELTGGGTRSEPQGDVS